jgi:hypothetical protein
VIFTCNNRSRRWGGYRVSPDVLAGETQIDHAVGALEPTVSTRPMREDQ